MNQIYFITSIIILIVLFQNNSYAQIKSSDLKYLARNSDAIITGKVVQQKSEWNENKTRIYTDAIIMVEEYLKGNDRNNKLTVSYPGGEIDGVGEIYSHLPRLSKDEEVLLFIKKDNGDKYKIYKGESGKITLKTEKDTGTKLTPDNRKLSLLKSEIKRILEE